MLPKAEETARQSLAVFAKSLPPKHLYVASGKLTLGEILLRRGSMAAAESELRSSVDINTALAGPDSWRTARSAASLGWLLIKSDRAAEGEPMLIAARAQLMATPTLGPNNPATLQATARLAEYLKAHHREDAAEKVLHGAAKP
jgi:hypothetical protein